MSAEHRRTPDAPVAQAHIPSPRRNGPLISECCGYPPVDEVDGDRIGMCSKCKEWASFVPEGYEE